ncbi:34105_t:CDS:1, partial [Gigaspora margarita]
PLVSEVVRMKKVKYRNTLKKLYGQRKKMAKYDVQNCTHKEYSCRNTSTTRPLWRYLEFAYWTQYVLTEEYCKKKKRVQKEYGSVDEVFKK